ncbi:hypothetical protein D3H35_11125 [Cohnella faecalis]|uniref:Uncharacterized protein n=1 Tax=Cohnella faecalis TaxID=2315694 RepID=A0A398CMW6_9BACL|nr:hypothetical protein D3H35_11125 [Cohnella faecalis]
MWKLNSHASAGYVSGMRVWKLNSRASNGYVSGKKGQRSAKGRLPVVVVYFVSIQTDDAVSFFAS